MNRRAGLTLLAAFVSVAAFTGAAHAQTTALFVDSEAGDWIGQGLQQTFTPADGTFQVLSTGRNRVQVSVNGQAFSFWWRLDFAAAGNVPLVVGAYESARRLSFTTGNGLDVSGSGRGCNVVTGRFVVREIAFGADDSLQQFAADFEQHCDDANPGLFGAIRYNSTISDLQPFDGNYPFYELTITPPAHGRVTAAGIDCGGTGMNCVVTPSTATVLALTATPDSGYAFAGWTGDCDGAITIWLRVNQRKRCAALFEPGLQGTTALRVDSQPGDYVGQGIQRTYTPQDGTFQISRNHRNGVSLSIRPPDLSFWWNLDFAALGNVPLAVGPYVAAGDFTSPLNGLRAYGSGRSCSGLTGRFVVLEVVYDTDGTVLRFAADFEQHCSDDVPALFGAVRYNSTIADVTPFGGDYPAYRLTVPQPEHGRVSGAGIDCGGASVSCQLSLLAAAHVILTAEPDSGYVFTGWAGDCRGAASTSVHVNGAKTCSAHFEPLVSASPRTLLYWHSEPGDSIGAGRQALYSPLNSVWSVPASAGGQSVFFHIEDAVDRWTIEFSAPLGRPLTVGYYSAARRYPFTPFNGLDASGSGRGCNQLTGRFIVLEVVIAPGGTVQRFAADFEQHCEDRVPALFGAIRYNSTIDEVLPFGGDYPAYQLSLGPVTHGRVTGPNLNCGGGNSQCQATLMAAAEIALTATPDFGYSFMGWTEDCSGGTSTTLHVNGPKRCAAVFEPTVATAPRTLLRWESEPGHSIGQGLSQIYSPANSGWTSTSLQNGSGVEIRVVSVGPRSDSSWTLLFLAPTGEVLQAGRRYAGADDIPAPGVPGIVLFGNGRYCGGGEFTVREIAVDSRNSVLRFAVDFILDCGSPTGPLLTGSLQYNSHVDVPTTTLSVDPSALRFASLHNGSSVLLQPLPQTVRLSVSRSNVGWTATTSQPWIQISPASGTGSTILTVSLNVLGGHPGSGGATGAITIILTDGSGTSQTVDVMVRLHLSGTTAPPLGIVDTPLPNSTGVTGAVPMTGWALDDLEVSGVSICRAAVTSEVAPVDSNCGGSSQIFVGHAVFIEGARPDVQAAFPNYPRNNMGGWGFMLLTNMLPNQGNGTFLFFVYARDREGHSVLLGTRTMTCDNTHATAPFGAIDTPGQGDTVAAGTFVNFGWALTPNPKAIPIDGSTLMVYIDGVPIGSPSYNHYRADIATLFPGFANSSGAVGFRLLDTTTLANGLHTIVWTATDSAGVTSGLGSRFFRVANAAGASVTPPATSASVLSAATIAALPREATNVAGRRGWDPETPWRRYRPEAGGRHVVRGEELDRLEIDLDARPGQTFAGYLRVGRTLTPLPAGSHLDSASGRFTWAPGAGFVGTYDLVFVRVAGSVPVSGRDVRVVLQPKATGRSAAQVVIDTPRWQQDAPQPFLLAGWAADFDATIGTGVDILHVWAYPLTGGAPVFLGAAAANGTRPDVAAVHGAQFRESGFGLLVQGLTPGNYDLAVFPWSTAHRDFLPAELVRVTVR